MRVHFCGCIRMPEAHIQFPVYTRELRRLRTVRIGVFGNKFLRILGFCASNAWNVNFNSSGNVNNNGKNNTNYVRCVRP